MDTLEVIARFAIRAEQLDGVRARAAEIVATTRARDTHTLRCDWFLNEDATACEVHELFPDEQGLAEHKMNTMEATVALFRDHASDHHSTIYGEVSPAFLEMVTARMGPPTVFTFVGGLATSVPPLPAGTRPFEVIARLKVRPGRLEGFRSQTAEIVRLTQELDTHTRRYDWFVNGDQTEFEVHEAYADEDGLVEHNQHVVEARDALFRDDAFDHRMSVYGEISPHLRELFQRHAGGVSTFTLLDGLETTAPV